MRFADHDSWFSVPFLLQNHAMKKRRTSTHGDETFEVPEWLVRICFEVVRRSFDLESRGQGARRPPKRASSHTRGKTVASTLAELAPQLRHPSWDATAAKLLAQTSDRSQVRKLTST